MYIFSDTYCGAPFFDSYKFCKWSKKGIRENCFDETTLAELFTIHVMEFPLIFGEINVVEVPKICKAYKIYSP